jgi:hypothetical protein
MNKLAASLLLLECVAGHAMANPASQNGIPLPSSAFDPTPLVAPAQLPAESQQTIPRHSAVVGKTLLDIVLDPGRRYDLPVTLLTALPVYSDTGQVALPAGTILTALIQKREGGDYIVIEKAVYRGLNVPIPSQGRLIPAQVKPENYGQFFVPPKTKASSVVDSVSNSNFISALLGVALAETYSENGGNNITPLLIGVLGVDIGVRFLSALFEQGPKQIPPLVEIPRDSLLVFTVSEDVRLPFSASPETPFSANPGGT